MWSMWKESHKRVFRSACIFYIVIVWLPQIGRLFTGLTVTVVMVKIWDFRPRCGTVGSMLCCSREKPEPVAQTTLKNYLHNAGECWDSEKNDSCAMKCVKQTKNQSNKTPKYSPTNLNSADTSSQQFIDFMWSPVFLRYLGSSSLMFLSLCFLAAFWMIFCTVSL